MPEKKLSFPRRNTDRIAHTNRMNNDLLTILIIEAFLIAGLAAFLLRRRRHMITEAQDGLGAVRGAAERGNASARQNAPEMRNLAALRARHLNEPLSERARPTQFADIIGQEAGIRALMAALCGPNPQHVLIYGPPGVGKTCAARLVLDEAKRRPDSPFTEESKFVEMDATCVRFDERAIADPLLGSVHDPIYQGAGALGSRGIPQPKPGAVTRAHCGVLFLDEIGELHPMQMNKLLKVLEDRCVHFESAYYAPDNGNIPAHIHDIFQNGLPADFRLVGATTRRPEELPAALRSRCVELYFKPLGFADRKRIAEGAAARAGMAMTDAAAAACARYAGSGRDAVNIVQLSAGIAYGEHRKEILEGDIGWVARTCNYAPMLVPHIAEQPRVGVMNMLAVAGAGSGMVMEIECTLKKSRRPRLVMNGIVEEEELDLRTKRLRRKSTARCSVENVLCAVSDLTGVDFEEYEVRFNIPGGLPADGPSAGIAIAIALYSALSGTPPLSRAAATGEVTIHGEVRPVGGVREKLAAAFEAGAELVLIPTGNDDAEFAAEPRAHAVGTLREAFSLVFGEQAVAGIAEPAMAEQLPL